MSDVNKATIRPMIAEACAAYHDHIETKFWSILDADGFAGVPSDMWDALDRTARAARNRDMWRGQCDRQAGHLRALRALLTRALELASKASTLDWREDHNIMCAVHLAADIRAAQGIEAAAADETQSGSAVGESPVAESHAPNPGQSHD